MTLRGRGPLSSPCRACVEPTSLIPTPESGFKAVAHVNELTRRHPAGTQKHPRFNAAMYSYRTGGACNLARNLMALVLEKTLRV